MARTQKSQNALMKLYHEFVADMGEYVFGMLNMHYQAMPNIKQNWTSIVPYTPQMEHNIIKHARMFLRLNIDTRTMHSATFMRELTFIMAKHIAEYIAPANKNLTFNQVAKTIQHDLSVFAPRDDSHAQLAKSQNQLERREYAHKNSAEIKKMFTGCYYGCNGRSH